MLTGHALDMTSATGWSLCTEARRQRRQAWAGAAAPQARARGGSSYSRDGSRVRGAGSLKAAASAAHAGQPPLE